MCFFYCCNIIRGSWNLPHFLLFFDYFMIWLHYFWFYYHPCNKIYTQSIYSIKKIQNQEVCYLGKSIYKQSRAFWTKKFSEFHLWGDILSELWKIWKYPAILHWLVGIFKNMMLFQVLFLLQSKSVLFSLGSLKMLSFMTIWMCNLFLTEAATQRCS